MLTCFRQQTPYSQRREGGPSLVNFSNICLRLVLAISLVGLAACGGSGSDSGTPPSSGNTPTPTATPAPAPPSGSDLTVETEDYARFMDSTPGNEGGAYRMDDVDIEVATDESGEFNIGYVEAGEWLEYDITLEAGTYVVATRIASNVGGGAYTLLLDGEEIAPDMVSSTGGWQTYETHQIGLVTVDESGEHLLRLQFDAGPFNINWISFTVDDGTFEPPVIVIEDPLELPDVEPVIDPNPIDPATAVSEMGIGINLGNTLDAPSEGAWARAAEEAYFDSFEEAGFTHVRIPVTWDNHTENALPYAVTQERMDRVEEIVDWALERDNYVILNAHHEGWFKGGYASQNTRNRFDSIWIQIAERFKNKSAKLIFEILNEPNGMSIGQIDEQNVRTLSIIRNVNPTRLVVFSGNGFTPIDALLEAAIPSDTDQYLIGNFHSYDPWPFAGQCRIEWGSDEDLAALEAIYQQAQDWSTMNGIPVTLNEFGVAKFDFTAPENVCDQEQRLEYIRAHVRFASERGIPITFWDDGGSFASYDRVNRTWGPEKDILVAPNLESTP